MKIRPAEEELCVKETMAFMHSVWVRTERGDKLPPNPFYPRTLTPEVVDNVLNAMEAIYETEITKYPGYHRTAQGISDNQFLVVPGFNKLPQGAKLYIVQGIDRIFLSHHWSDEDERLDKVSKAATANALAASAEEFAYRHYTEGTRPAPVQPYYDEYWY